MYIWIPIIIFFLLTHLIAQYIGKERKIGYGQSVFWSILLTPLIGLIITILSPRIER